MQCCPDPALLSYMQATETCNSCILYQCSWYFHEFSFSSWWTGIRVFLSVYHRYLLRVLVNRKLPNWWHFSYSVLEIGHENGKKSRTHSERVCGVWMQFKTKVSKLKNIQCYWFCNAIKKSKHNCMLKTIFLGYIYRSLLFVNT